MASILEAQGGVFEPEIDVEYHPGLRAAFPEAPLRVDPNGAWHVQQPEAPAQIRRLLEYMEDPTFGIPGMAVVQRAAPMPLATNMCFVAFEHLRRRWPGCRPVVLADHHFWGGLVATRELGRIWRSGASALDALELASGHQPHGDGLVAAATPNLTYACDTHYPWEEDEVSRGGVTFEEGSLRLPEGPASASSSTWERSEAARELPRLRHKKA
jgi:glucarate dehydratase